MRPRLAFIALVLIYTALASLYAVNTPLWQVPDEPAHYNYIRTVAEQAALPVLQMGDYDQAYLEKIKAEKFRPDLPIDPIRYESHQPPLYYLLAAPVYKAGQTASLAARVMGLRLFSVLWGVVLLALIYQIARAVFDADEVVPLLAVALAAFVPQHLAMEASVNNDPLAEVALAGVALGLVKILKGAGARRWWWMVGALTGLGFLTKTTTYVSVGLIAVTLLMLARSEGYSRKPKELLSLIALPLGLAFFLGMLWFARNALIYGPTDWLALSRHRAVVAGQPTTIALYGDYLTAATVFFPILFRSFWGQFGWMGVVLDARIYDGLLAFSVFALLGLAIRFRALSRREVPSVKFRFWARRRRASDQSAQLILLLVWFGFVLAVTMGYSLEFFQAQGRYLFPALGAIAIGLALGLRQWIGLAARGLSHLTRRGIPRAVSEWGLMGALSAALIALDWICLYRYIIPALTVGR